MLRAHARRVGFAFLLITFVATAAAEPPETGEPPSLDDEVQCAQDTQCTQATATAAHDEANATATPYADEAERTVAQQDDEVRQAAQAASGTAKQATREARGAAQSAADLLLEQVDLIRRDVERRAWEAAATLDPLLDPVEEADAETEAAPLAADGEALIPRVAAAVLWVAGATAAGAAMVWLLSGGTVAGAATSGSTTSAAEAARRYAPGLALFTRFEGAKVLEHPNRAQLYDLVSRNPGIRLQDLCRETDLSRTAVTHHLRLLENQHLIVSRRVGRSRHFFENGGRFRREQKEAYAVLQNDRSKEIADVILGSPGIIQKALCEALDLRPSIVHWHVQRLQEAGLIQADRQGRTVAYYPEGALSSMGN